MDDFEAQLKIEVTVYVDDVPFKEEFWVKEFRFMSDTLIGRAKDINKALRKVYNPDETDYKFEFFGGKADGMRYSTKWRKVWERTILSRLAVLLGCTDFSIINNWNLHFEGFRQTPKGKKKKK